MSIFEHRNPPAEQLPPDLLIKLRTTLERLHAQAVETPQMADLKRILTGKIAELERTSA
jgi:hypothetical protein